MNILLSAYACEPRKGSEPGVGWNMAHELAQYHQVWVLTSFAHREAIELELKQNPVPSLQFIYLDPFRWTYDWTNEAQKVHWSIHLHYYFWQIWAYFIARSHHAQVQFELVHHVTYVKYSGPSFVSLLPIPFVWGPVGGGESAPSAFWSEFSPRGRLYEVLRSVARWIGERDPFVRLTVARSRLVWATTEETAIRLRTMGARKVELLSQLGLQQSEMMLLAQATRPHPAPIRFVSVGRLLHWKGFHLGLRAFAALELTEAEFWIIGDGPERQRLQAIAEELGIADQVTFYSQLSRSETLHTMALCSALVHPSLHESGGLVCLEAMAAGLPVLCLDLGGPALQVIDETGFKVSSLSPERAISELSKAMLTLAQQPELADQMGRSAQARVKDCFSWHAKGRFISQTYLDIYEQWSQSKRTQKESAEVRCSPKDES
jgi:glycosyltransferase involved in cell wall biosynthesis